MGWNVVNQFRPYRFYDPALFPPAPFTRLLILKRQKIHFKGPLIQDARFKWRKESVKNHVSISSAAHGKHLALIQDLPSKGKKKAGQISGLSVQI